MKPSSAALVAQDVGPDARNILDTQGAVAGVSVLRNPGSCATTSVSGSCNRDGVVARAPGFRSTETPATADGSRNKITTAAGIRNAFTLMELLVAIAVISILVALTAAGVFQVVETQRENNTKNTMLTVDKLLKQQMKAVMEKADKETVPPSVIALSGSDANAPKRARLIWKKLRLKQEFPMTFAEAKQPWLTFAGTSVGVQPTDLPAKQSYVNALASLPATINTGSMPFLESSALVLLALQEKREGVALNIDELGSAAIDLSSGVVPSFNGGGLKKLVDGWNNPIAFFRFPTSNDATTPGNNALDASNPAGPSDTAAKFRDPYDAQGLLLNPSWNNFTSWSTSGGVASFENLCHVVHAPNSTTATSANYQVWPRYMVPVLVSPGRDGKWGINNAFHPSANPQVGVNPNMSIDANSQTHAFDNVYSYQLKQ